MGNRYMTASATSSPVFSAVVVTAVIFALRFILCLQHNLLFAAINYQSGLEIYVAVRILIALVALLCCRAKLSIPLIEWRSDAAFSWVI